MILKDFVKQYIEYNSLVRLVYSNKSVYKVVLNEWSDVDMGHQIIKGVGKYANYINHEVLGITSILTSENYPHAINIVIKEIPLDELREIKLNKII